MKLSINLLKEEFDITNSLKDDSNLKIFDWESDKNIKLYAEDIKSDVSSWKTFINNGVGENIFSLKNANSSAILFVNVKQRIMVITFGFGHLKLKDNCCVKNFGLKVVLNSVKEDTIKSIDIRTNDENSLKKRIQNSKNSEISAFNIDTQIDILKEITGIPKSNVFAKQLTGKHSLIINCEIDNNQISKKCEEIYEAYENENYKKHFGWIDNIQYIEDKDEIKKLNEVLFEDIKNCLANKVESNLLYLSFPDMVDYGNFGMIKFAGFRSREKFETLDIQDYIGELKRLDFEIFSMDDIKKHKVCEIGDDDNCIHEWNLFDCIVYEVSKEANRYILCDGQWYKINTNFVEEIQKYIQENINQISILPQAYKDENETKYNSRLEQENKTNLVCMDKKLFKGSKWNSAIEACDFFSSNLQFIHIKNETSSSKLSHLFNQGLVSAEAFLREQEFRETFIDSVKKINKEIAKPLLKFKKKFERDKFEIVYGILTKHNQNKQDQLPFFSQVSLVNISKKLADIGYKVSINYINKSLEQKDLK